MNPILLDLGFIEIRWYSVLILIAFIVGYFLVVNRCKKSDISLVFISDLCFYLIIFCILGARLYYCIFNLDYYSKNIIDILKIWEGGLAIHGGIIAGILVIFFYTKKHNIPLLKVLDIFAPALVLGQAIGRWGNFINQEAFGRPTNGIIKLFVDIQYRPSNMQDFQFFHPAFLYESILDFICFLILIIFFLKCKNIKSGTITFLYLILYSIIRICVESLRVDSILSLAGLHIATIISITILIISLICLVALYRKN